MAQGMSLW